MVAIKPVSRSEGDEELRAISVWARVGHGQLSPLEVAKGHVLIRELSSVNGETTSAVALCEVAPLSHEVTDDAMKVALLVSVTLLVVSRAEGSEVLHSLRVVVLVEL